MYIVVIGGGNIGFYLARTLIEEGHEILVVERDRREVEYIANELGDVAMQGDGCEVSTLEDAGCGRADMLVAVTGGDEDNLVSCQVAKARFQVSRTVARINNPKNREIFRRLGIDVTVSSTELILEHIEQEVPTHPLVHLADLTGGEFKLVSVRVPQGSDAVGRQIADLSLPSDVLIGLVIKKEAGPQVVRGDTRLDGEDTVFAIVKPENESTLRGVLAGF